MAVRLEELARWIGAEIHGDKDCLVSNVATLDTAQKGDIATLYDRRYRTFLKVTGASAVILSPADLPACPVSALVTDNPYLAYARASNFLNPPPEFSPGIHPSACVASGVTIDASACVGPQVVIEAGARVGAHAVIGPGSILHRQVTIGDYTRLVARVTVVTGTIGRRCLIHPGVVIGADGFGFARDQGVWVKVPQIGSVHIGNDVEIGANTTIDRGALKDTVIEDGVKLDNLVQIGHNTRIGAHTAIAGCVGIAGSVRIGKRCLIGGGAGIAGHLEIADDVVLTAKAQVSKSILRPGTYMSAWPAREAREWKKRWALFSRLAHLHHKTI
jgi:UDP-3-O-[3-hydroxymyristoyl] glucosamine N-acyltransferase